MTSLSSDFEDDRDSSESENGWTNLKSLVLDRISGVHSAGSFATFGHFENFVQPGIFVEEIGTIRLPLSSQDAQSLIRASRPAPFGKGNQTLVDETVRKTWEIDGSKVSFSNKAWHGWLEGVVRTAAEDLGVAGGPNSVRAELYKMLLYEQGAMFKPHKESTEKTAGMFATLVICLPSEHVGGTVRLTHCQKEKTFDTAEFSAFNTTYVAWYADVTHEIKPVQSGYRWILTYNLVNTSSSFPQSAAGLDAQITRFCQTLAEWRGLKEGPQCLCYALDHQYTDAGLKLTNLKCNDYYRARYVADSCGKAGDFCVMLASLQKVVTFENDEGGEEDAQSELRLEHITDLEGFTLQKSLRIPENFLLQQSLYDSRDPDSQNGGEFLGNQHADIDQFYKNTVMLIVPKASATSFLLENGHNLDDFKKFLQRLQKGFKTRDNAPHIRELIVQTCQSHLTRAYPDDMCKDLFLGPIAIAAIFITDQGLFRNTVRAVTNGFDENIFFVLGELVSFKTPTIPEEDLIEAFSRILKLHKIWRCLQTFRKGFSRDKVSPDEHQYLANWVRNRLSEALKSLTEAHPQDGAALIEIANKYDDKMFEEFIKPFVTRFVGDSNFLNALTVEILSFSQSSSPDKDLVARLLPLVLDASASQFELQKFSSASKGSSSRGDYPYSSWPNCCKEEERGRHDASVIVCLYEQLLRTDRKKASELLGRIQLQTESIAYNELDRLVVPLLEKMIYIIDLCSANACQFYQSMLATYITRVVQKEPEKPRDWSRPKERKKCYYSTCSDCQSLQEFLMDPGEESRRFVLPKDPWHLKHSVPGQCKATTDESQEPPVLVVAKTLKGWEENHMAWQKRASEAQETFKRLPQIALKQCLADKYDAIMDLRMVKLQDEGSAAQTTDSSERRIGNRFRERSRPTVPQKRSRSDS